MFYKVLRIDEDVDYGCEERPEGSPVMAVVTMEDSEGRKIVARIKDNFLYQSDVNEGDLLRVQEDGSIEKG